MSEPRALHVAPQPEATPELQTLSGRFWGLLKHGDLGMSETALVGTLCAEAARCDKGFEWLWDRLRDPRNAGGEAVRERVIHKRTVQRWYEDSHAQFEHTYDRTEARARAAALREWADEYVWPGRGNTLCQVYAAHITIALETGSLTYPASVRYLGDVSGVTRASVERANAKLRKLGLLRRQPRARGAGPQTATRYTLSQKPLQERQVPGQQNPGRRPVGLVVPLVATQGLPDKTHPVFRYGSGLKYDVWRSTFDLISPVVADIADHLKRSPRTVRQQVANLERVGLLVRMDDGTLQGVSDHELFDSVARQTGMAQRQRLQEDRHAYDRCVHQHHVERKAAERSGKTPLVDGVLNPATGEVEPYRNPRPEPIALREARHRIPTVAELRRRAAAPRPDGDFRPSLVTLAVPLFGDDAEHVICQLVGKGLSVDRARFLVERHPLSSIVEMLQA